MKWRKLLVTLIVLVIAGGGTYAQFWLKRPMLSYFLMLLAIAVEFLRVEIYGKLKR